jgi:hypothetical protein
LRHIESDGIEATDSGSAEGFPLADGLRHIPISFYRYPNTDIKASVIFFDP